MIDLAGHRGGERLVDKHDSRIRLECVSHGVELGIDTSIPGLVASDLDPAIHNLTRK